MDAIKIIDAFYERGSSDREITALEFGNMATSLAQLSESYQIRQLPVLMAYVIRHGNNMRKTHFGDMVVYRLMPQPEGWKNLIDEMNAAEVDVTLEWLLTCKEFPFAVNCSDELRLAIELFNERSNSGNQ
jgi:hypothetical protein